MQIVTVTLADVTASVEATIKAEAGRRRADTRFQKRLGEQAVVAFRAMSSGITAEGYAAENLRIKEADPELADRRSVPGLYTSGPAVRFFAAVGHLLSLPGDALAVTTEQLITVAKSVYQKGGTERGDAVLAAAADKASAYKALKALGATLADEKKAKDKAAAEAKAATAARAATALVAEAEADDDDITVAEPSAASLLDDALQIIRRALAMGPLDAESVDIQADLFDALNGAVVAEPVPAAV